MTGDKKRGTGGNLARRETQHPTAKPINKLFRRNSICFFVDCAKQRVLPYAGASSHEHRIKKGDKKKNAETASNSNSHTLEKALRTRTAKVNCLGNDAYVSRSHSGFVWFCYIFGKGSLAQYASLPNCSVCNCLKRPPNGGLEWVGTV